MNSNMKTFSNILSKAPDAARAYVDGKKVDEVECIVSDLPGIARGKAVPAQKFLRQKTFHLPDSIFFCLLYTSPSPRD